MLAIGAGNDGRGAWGNFWGGQKCSRTAMEMGAQFINLLKIIELCPYNGLILGYVKYIS